MRKKDASKILTPVAGGVCAPAGFSVVGVRCGCSARADKEDLALVSANKRVPVAGVFSQNALVGAPVRLSQKHLRLGYTRGVIVNSGVANVWQENGEEHAQRICRDVAKKLRADTNEILIASTGEIGAKFPVEKILSGLDELVKNLGCTDEHGESVARALMTTDKTSKQLSYSFDLGNYICKIGVVFKGGRRVCPNMATTLCILTTDVKITSEMLSKALTASTNNTLNLLDIDGVSSPNDCVFAMASGEVGNYLISCADSEYLKFADALECVLGEVCQVLAKDGETGDKLLICETVGTKSKKTARAIAKAVVGANALKESIAKNGLDTQTLLCIVGDAREPISLKNAEILLFSETGRITLSLGGKILATAPATLATILSAEEITVKIDFAEGNYGARAIGCVRKAR